MTLFTPQRPRWIITFRADMVDSFQKYTVERLFCSSLGLGWTIIMLKSWSWLKDDYAQVLVLVERLLCSSLGQTHHGGTNAYLLLKESAHTKFCFSNPGLRQWFRGPYFTIDTFWNRHRLMYFSETDKNYVSVLYVYIWNLKRVLLK